MRHQNQYREGRGPYKKVLRKDVKWEVSSRLKEKGRTEGVRSFRISLVLYPYKMIYKIKVVLVSLTVYLLRSVCRGRDLRVSELCVCIDT